MSNYTIEKCKKEEEEFVKNAWNSPQKPNNIDETHGRICSFTHRKGNVNVQVCQNSAFLRMRVSTSARFKVFTANWKMTFGTRFSLPSEQVIKYFLFFTVTVKLRC